MWISTQLRVTTTCTDGYTALKKAPAQIGCHPLVLQSQPTNEADAGNQILGYVGNSIACTVIMNTLSSELYVENGVEYPELDEKTWRYQFKSGYYDNSYNKAVESFWLHDQGYTTYEYQVLHGVKLQFLMPIGSNSGKEFFSVPYAGTTFL